MATIPQNNTGTGYTNLQRILGANQNNALGSTVAAGVQKAGQQATGSINSANQTFQTGVNNERTRLGQAGQEVNNVLGNIPAATDSDINQFADIRAGQSKGPTGLANSDQIMNQAQTAKQLGQAGSSETGRYGLLQRYVGNNGNYSQGNQKLDNLLLGQTGQPQLRQARAATAGLENQANNAINAAGAVGQEVQGEAKQLGQNTINRLQGTVTDYDTAMQNKLNAGQAQRQSYLDTLNGNTNSAVNLDSRALSDLSSASNGILGAGTNLYNTDISPYVQLNSLYASTPYVQSTSDLAKAQMIGKLSGADLGAQDSTLQNYISNPNSAGQYESNNYFNVASPIDLNAALQNSANNYNTKAADINSTITNTQKTIGQDTGGLSDAVNRFLQNQAAKDQGLVPDNVGGGDYSGSTSQQYQQAFNALNPNLSGQQAQDWAAANGNTQAAAPYDFTGLNQKVQDDYRALGNFKQNAVNNDQAFKILRKLQQTPAAT